MNNNGFDEIRDEVIQEMRGLADRGADVPEIVELLLRNLGIEEDKAIFPVLIYFQRAFCLTLREALPLREWLAGKDRSEVDSLLIPAMQRRKENWRPKELQKV